MNFGFTSGNGIALLLGGALIAGLAQHGQSDAAADRRRAALAARVPGDGDSGPGARTPDADDGLRAAAARPAHWPRVHAHRAAPIRAVLAHLWRERAAFGPMFLGLACNSLAMGTLLWAAPFYERTYGWGPAQYGIIQGFVYLLDRTLRPGIRRLAGRALGPPGSGRCEPARRTGGRAGTHALCDRLRADAEPVSRARLLRASTWC